jgi:hypothetical protein
MSGYLSYGEPKRFGAIKKLILRTGKVEIDSEAITF